VIESSSRPLSGGESIFWDGKVVGITTSADYGHTIGKWVAFGYLPNHLLDHKLFEIAVYGEKVPAMRQHPLNRPLYDHLRNKILA